MKILTAEYVKSFVSYEGYDLPLLPQFAFIGRSNVGKSSLINHLLLRKKLVKTSSTPGKTQALNFFLINRSFYIVDLPGYGFAKAPQGEREKWKYMIDFYLRTSKELKLIFLLLDLRHEPSKEDQAFHAYLCERNLPFVLVANKADKLNKSRRQKQVARLKKVLGAQQPILLHSTLAKLGREELWAQFKSSP